MSSTTSTSISKEHAEFLSFIFRIAGIDGLGISKEQKYLLNSKTFMENSGELTKLCLERSKGDIKFTVMVVRKYTSFVVDWLKENWKVRDDIKEELVALFTPFQVRVLFTHHHAHRG